MADWYQIKQYDLGVERTNHKITDFPDEGNCIVVLENQNATLAQTYIRFNSQSAHPFDLYKRRKLRHKFKTLYLTNSASSDNDLRLLIGKGKWDVERQYPRSEISSVNADTVDYIHARSH